jgi:hypothetical protein
VAVEIQTAVVASRERLVATDESGRIVGDYGGMPFEMKLGDEVVPAFAHVGEYGRGAALNDHGRQ